MEADAARFAGRARELALFDRLLGDSERVSVVLVHGAGGVGKSTLLREVGRRGAAAGYGVFAIDGRELSPAPGDLERALDGIESVERPLLLLDTYERVAALGPHLRTRVLPQLPAAARVVIAGRLAPDDGWRQDGWDAITLPVALAPLSAEDALALLAACAASPIRSRARSSSPGPAVRRWRWRWPPTACSRPGSRVPATTASWYGGWSATSSTAPTSTSWPPRPSPTPSTRACWRTSSTTSTAITRSRGCEASRSPRRWAVA